ncbi:MAG: ATP-binding protein [Aestuariivita sp.]|nr:ATP-binding protein [Aestuariivita sp.]MCY4201954.1 ATP-binding protein [Aestuariivita sp.]
MKNILERIAAALERMQPSLPAKPDFAHAAAYIWQIEPDRFEVVRSVNRIDIDLLVGIDQAREALWENTKRFAEGYAANNALLWGARGMGKSSLVKAVHAEILSQYPELKLVELQREDLASVGRLLQQLRAEPYQFILMCDDLSFASSDEHYQNLKVVLDGGIAGRPRNVVFYATSNRRHLMPRDMIENERSSAINPSEAVEEKVSLSDRFGLWLGFYPCSQDEFMSMITGYCEGYRVDYDAEILKAEALAWQAARGARSGRVAWQFFVDYAGRHSVRI